VLRSETVQREQEQAQVAALNQRAAELSGQLAEKTAAQHSWQQRESELEQCTRRQEEQLGASRIAATSLEAELKSLRGTLDDMSVIQSALWCAGAGTDRATGCRRPANP